ncbi:2OG-Fe dioxygenase-domain-containing protein [Rhodocollybia butyracea]|uniref:2OG-Fe dioxygenase-domain-containing protein n=1 Tax=Rhodocollybia butyracea TaxID=206335 RepID=A0A9P5U592_9AGAR|nr:2OG-Fe dioxygenase-domain-containing protein [Rhodocollybia butyracea]
MVLSSSLLSELHLLRQQFIKERTLWIPSTEMVRICRGLGASTYDMKAARTVSDSLRTDPTLPFRRSKNGRFALNFESRHVSRLEPQPFILSAAEDFVRYDSGKVREFEDVDAPLQYNSVLHALFRFKAFMINGVDINHRPGLDYTSASSVCTLFHLRTVTDAREGLLGQPALEGVHSDGVDFTMTTLLGHQNMRGDSAETFLHTLQERNAIAWHETDPAFLLGKVQHMDFLDTLLICDHERKHSLSPVYSVDESKEALRDMLIFFTRKPVVEGHVSYPYDSFKEHQRLPLMVEML